MTRFLQQRFLFSWKLRKTLVAKLETKRLWTTVVWMWSLWTGLCGCGRGFVDVVGVAIVKWSDKRWSDEMDNREDPASIFNALG
ncbi:hypothetical protein F2Q69_00024831 [Brassica cretica]|uniref:Uncharacterized protein n=1 Tax=Brassica cretica TaxID=69181 RepID=A0A8S9Q495_BRACR|nr:hypothetical protein F2Q69_00024831 [Brassica cretica]